MKIILGIAVLLMLVLSSSVVNAAFSFRGYMPGDGYTAINDVHDYEILQIEEFLGFDALQQLVYLDKWEQGGGNEEGILTVDEYAPDSDGYAGMWSSSAPVSVLTVKADGMIGIWSGDFDDGSIDWRYDLSLSALSGGWDTHFTMPPSGTYINGAQMSHITAWTGIDDGGDRDIDPPTVSEPATALLIGLGMIGMIGFSRKQKS